ncbi:unnamed protein product [Mytilus coruscus]|uniref:Uncharacterized protein n=1 Tax=Mytilus coruscus TaxID=42192 RepID=A0A6J8BQ01_MYTCO|nr:unnamed protein product [Mytilus coruscus]
MLDTDGSTTILSTSKLYPSHKITRAAKVNIVVGKQRLLGEIIDLSVSVDKLKTVQKEWGASGRVLTIHYEESGDYTDEVGQANRKPFFTDHLKDDEREILRQQTQPVIILEDNSLDHSSIDTFMRTFSLNKDMASVSTQTRTVQIAATDAELKDYTRKTHSLTLQDLPKTKGDAESEETGINATNATSPIVVETPLEQTEKRNVIAKVGIHTAREEEENDGIQEEYNVEQEEKNYATQKEKNNVAQEDPLEDETKCTSTNVFKSKDTILGPQLTAF